MKVSIIGTGYVGITTGACLAQKGHHVICVDKQASIIEAINSGKSTIYEPGLEELLEQVISEGRLEATTNTRYAVENSDVTIISVGTPYVNGAIDLSYIKNAAEEIGEALRFKNTYHVICVKSTVIPATTDKLVKNILEKASGKTEGEYGLAMNPEFLREGSAVSDFLFPDRIVIGANDDSSFNVMRELYECFIEAPVVRVNLRTAELIKYASNSLLATLISFSNEIASIAEEIGEIDIKEVHEAVTLDKRLNPIIEGMRVNPLFLEYLKAGCGFGGSCFPKDVNALISFSEENGYRPEILKSVMSINKKQPLRLLQRLEKTLLGLENKNVIVLGLAFKPDTDDVRESPAILIIRYLLEKGAKVYAIDPIATKSACEIFGESDKIVYLNSLNNIVIEADAVVLVTAWKEFANIEPDYFMKLMRRPVVVDGRRVFDKVILENLGIEYIGIGLS